MLEAIRKKWQVVLDDSGGSRSLTILEAAAELGVGVFASGPLGEGGLLSDLAIKVGSLSLPFLRPFAESVFLQRRWKALLTADEFLNLNQNPFFITGDAAYVISEWYPEVVLQKSSAI